MAGWDRGRDGLVTGSSDTDRIAPEIGGEKDDVAWLAIPSGYDSPGMELRHLRYFVAVAEELNITRAAARLHVSQPPLSRQIRDLEDELGVVLLERGARKLSLTPAGRVFFRESRSLLARVDEAVRKTRAAAGQGGGEIRIGYAPSPTVELLPRALRAFRKAAPQARPVLLDLSTDEMITRLADGSLDVALLVRPPLKAGAGVIFELLFELPVGLIVAPKHPFARRRSLKIEEALEEPIVAFIREGYADYHEWLGGVLRSTDRKPRIIAQADGAPSLVAAVESGQGIAFGPSTFSSANGGRIRFVPISPPPPPLEVGFAIRRRRPGELVNAFVESLRSSARGLPGFNAPGSKDA